jgi:hypothetical protein
MKKLNVRTSNVKGGKKIVVKWRGLSINKSNKWAKAWCIELKRTSPTLFFQARKSNRKLRNDCIKYFMVLTQICMVIYICNEMKKKLQLELVALYFWIFKTTNVSCNKLCGLCFQWKNKFLNFNHMNWSNILYMTCRNWNSWDVLFYFIFLCALNFKYLLKFIMDIQMKSWKKNLGTICLYCECEEWCETNNNIQYNPWGMMNI